MPEPPKPTAIALMSGGMDSTVCVAMARADGYELAALHVNYGQRTQQRELLAFHAIADFYSINRRLVVDIGHLALIGGSCLTDSSIPVPLYDDTNGDIPISYVPFRNANILAIGVSWAEVIGAASIYIGAVEEDAAGYPDCRKVFFEAFERVIETGAKPGSHINIRTPLIDMNKADIARHGTNLGAPFHLTWSCYQNEHRACGKCDSCARRLRGFSLAGLTDPILYC